MYQVYSPSTSFLYVLGKGKDFEEQIEQGGIKCF
jgi:hypothetical protein